MKKEEEEGKKEREVNRLGDARLGRTRREERREGGGTISEKLDNYCRGECRHRFFKGFLTNCCDGFRFFFF